MLLNITKPVERLFWNELLSPGFRLWSLAFCQSDQWTHYVTQRPVSKVNLSGLNSGFLRDVIIGFLLSQ